MFQKVEVRYVSCDPMVRLLRLRLKSGILIQKIDDLIKQIRELGGETKIVMESTGRYQLPLLKKLKDANLSVCLVNAKLIKDYQYDNTLRCVKSDKAELAEDYVKNAV